MEIGINKSRKMQIIPTARRTGIVVKKLNDEVLVYDTERHQAHCLNENAALIWEHCDGERTINELSDLLRNNSNSSITPKESGDLVIIALDQLEKSNLLEAPVMKTTQANGLSRRQLMKAAGIAALIAIPVVSTMVAPTAAQASTCLASGQPCGTSAECCSGLCSVNVCV